MRRCVLIALSALLVTVFTADASAAKKKKKQAEPTPEPVEEVEEDACPELVQENTLEGCRDGVDNDGDGHLDCADQDCEIYAMCVVAPKAMPAPPKPVPVFTNMRQLKQARSARQITAQQFHQAWTQLRQARSAELEQLKAAYHSGHLDRRDYREERRAIIARYEG